MAIDLNAYVCFNFYKGWREVSAFYKDVLGNDVSPQNVYILESCDLEEQLTMQQLAAKLQLDGSAVSTLVSRMEKKGLLKRTHGTEDRRTVFVQLTKEGDDLRNELRKKTGLLTEGISKNLADEDLKKLQDIVKTIAKNRQDLL
jgi:DNA-binding MarR family transcriptional regulator